MLVPPVRKSGSRLAIVARMIVWSWSFLLFDRNTQLFAAPSCLFLSILLPPSALFPDTYFPERSFVQFPDRGAPTSAQVKQRQPLTRCVGWLCLCSIPSSDWFARKKVPLLRVLISDRQSGIFQWWRVTKATTFRSSISSTAISHDCFPTIVDSFRTSIAFIS